MAENIHAVIDELAERYELETILNSPIDEIESPFDDGWLDWDEN